MDKILKAIESSQHCQRNWDLDKTIESEHLKIFEYVLKNAPSKQNIAFYKIHFIFNRNLIKDIYDNTATYSARPIEFYNPQTLANLLVVFEEVLYFNTINENNEIIAYKQRDKLTKAQRSMIEETIKQDRLQAVGIASGQLALVANYLGYKTGFCKCFDSSAIEKILNLDNKISLLLGIGYSVENIDHNIHHLDREISTRLRPKVEIGISTIY